MIHLSEITDPSGREETRWLLAVLPFPVRSSELQRLGKKGAVFLSFLKKTESRRQCVRTEKTAGGLAK